jgi:outer membrane protein W
MLRKSLVALLAVVLFGALFAAPAHAQSQAVSFNIGGFFLRGEDARLADGDILATELNAGFIDALSFRLKDFNNVTVGGEWLIGLGDFLEGGVGIAYYSSGGVPSVSANFVNTNNAEITQTLRLRMVPITATVRFLPLGRSSVVEPYAGAGIAVIPWRYSEVGQFLDSQQNIFTANFAATGTNVGPIVLGGARVPFGNFAIGGEVRWQKAHGTLPTSQFLSDRIDLGGVTAQATFVVRFGGR